MAKVDLSPLIEPLALRIAELLQEGLRRQLIQPRLLTIKQAALYIGRTEKATYTLTASGVFPSVRADGRVMLDRNDLDQWIESNKTRLG